MSEFFLGRKLKMDIDITHIGWGLLGVVFVRKLWNMLQKDQIMKEEVLGKPVEMRDVDATEMKGLTFTPLGSFAKQ